MNREWKWVRAFAGTTSSDLPTTGKTMRGRLARILRHSATRRWLASAVATLATTITTLLHAAPDLPPGVRLIDGYIPRFEQKIHGHHDVAVALQPLQPPVDIPRRNRSATFGASSTI